MKSVRREGPLDIFARKTLLAAGLLFVLALSSFGQTSTAKVVGVTDGDTITVYNRAERTRIRLEGIDCPEDGADFSRRAKQFTSDLVFGQDILIVGKERDRYGRLVARVHVGDTDLSLALVEAGLAWHYTQYSSDPVLAEAERDARNRKVGVWSLPNPIPPWQSRLERSATGAGDEGQDCNTKPIAGTFHGNRRSKIFHAPRCQHYNCSNCTVNLSSPQEAARQGFRPHAQCIDAAAPSPFASLEASAPESTASSGTVYHGNSKSKVYHAPGCRHYQCKYCTVILNSKEEADSGGFRPHSGRGGCVR